MAQKADLERKNGEAHRAAELQALEAEQAALEKQRREYTLEMNQKERGKLAAQKVRTLREKQMALDEEIRRIERKKKVFQEESKIAHQIAEKKRQAGPKIPQQEQQVTAAKLFNREPPQIDYTQTRFHTNLTSQPTACVISETIDQQRQAFEKAKELASLASI